MELHPPLHLDVVAIEKGAFGLPSMKVANFILLWNETQAEFEHVLSNSFLMMITVTVNVTLLNLVFFFFFFLRRHQEDLDIVT